MFNRKFIYKSGVHKNSPGSRNKSESLTWKHCSFKARTLEDPWGVSVDRERRRPQDRAAGHSLTRRGGEEEGQEKENKRLPTGWETAF